MDRYKFRGKRLDNGEWVYGNYQAGKGIHPHVISWWTVHDFEGDVSDEIDVAEVDPATVGQYIGISDTNGNQIYSNHHVRIVVKSWSTGKVMADKTLPVEFKNGRYGFQWTNHEFASFDGFTNTDFYVVEG